MSVDRAVDRVLERLSDAQVETLAKACEGDGAVSGLGAFIAGASPAGRDAVEKLASSLKSHPGLTGAGAALALRAALRARREARARRSRPVWTGPGASGEQRLTAGVLHELLAGARERILLVSYATHTLSRLADDLAAAVERGCEVDAVFETEEDSAGAYSGPATPYAAVAGVRRWRWPLAERPGSGASLHAKLLVVDRRRALVGSANLTDRALHANLEAGVLIRDPEVAAELHDHVAGLIGAGRLTRDP